MKDSDILFCNQIPDSWDSIPNKYLFDCQSKIVGKDAHNYQLLSLTTNGVKTKDINSGGGKVPENYEKYQTVNPGDMIFCLFDLDVSAVFSGLSNLSGMITSAYDVLKPKSTILDENYCKFWFQYVFSNRYYKIYSKNIRYTISSDTFGSIKTPIPPLTVQKRVGSFLENTSINIDELIDIENEQIEKIKEYRQSLITEVITKGINSADKLCDSCIDWIGQVPDSWQLIKLKYVFSNRNEKYNGGDYPYIALENIESFSGKYVPTETNASYSLEGTISARKNDVIFGKLRPYLAKSFIIQNDSYVSTEFAVFYSPNNSTKFLHYLFLSSKFIDVINSSTNGTKMPRANIDFINNLYIALPSLEVQKQIVEYLDEKCKEIEELIILKKHKIDLLEEYKCSLIYECVTGKQEVS